ncbi:hypothetical protein D9M71_565180 [compost metagenome]
MSPRISWYAPTRNTPIMYSSPSLTSCTGRLVSMLCSSTYWVILPSESQVRSCSTARRSGSSPRRWIGRIGSTWPMAQVSGRLWNTEKLQMYLSASLSLSSSSTWRWERWRALSWLCRRRQMAK